MEVTSQAGGQDDGRREGSGTIFAGSHSLVMARGFGSATGFTLIELLVTFTLFALTSLGFASLVVTAIQANRATQATDTAIFLAQDRLEAIRNTPYSNIIPANFPDEAYGQVTAGNPPTPYPRFRRTVTIFDDTPFPGMKRVVVTVSWRGQSGGEVSVAEEILVR